MVFVSRTAHSIHARTRRRSHLSIHNGGRRGLELATGRPLASSMPQDPRKRTGPSAVLLRDDDGVEDEDVDMEMPLLSTVVTTNTELLDQIVTPSPYPQHNSGPTSSRYRNALNRVTTSPTTDVEAWQALLSEVNSSYKALPSIYLHDAETHAKLDWAESCYGALLRYFPYAANHYATIVEWLLAQSARVGEENGPLVDYGVETSKRAVRCEAKVNRIFQKVLGIGSTSEDAVSNGMCVWSVQLWLLFIKKAVRDAHREALTKPYDAKGRIAFVRIQSQRAYETAVSSAGFCHNNHMLWKQYLAFVMSWDVASEPTLVQTRMLQLRSIYQRLICIPMTGLDQLWQEYEAFERGQSEALAQALSQEFSPKYQHARTIFLERNRVYGAVDLELGRLATDPVQEEEDDFSAKMEDEYKLLKLWKVRCAYERANPERLSPSDLAQRIRTSYRELISVWTRYPECWSMWSMWELHDAHDTSQAIAVLQLGQTHIPDCTLLAHAEADIVELNTELPENCISVMERFIERNPNTLGFVLYQKLVRRYRGAEEARAVFARARRILVDMSCDDKKEEKNATEGGEAQGEQVENEQAGAKADEDDIKRWLVTNRLDSSVGAPSAVDPALSTVGANGSNDLRGPVTWHLFAAHANIEHRVNRSPEVAARIYELGLRKHAAFLTKSQYVLRYAQLLLELNDTMNLRALLTRAVSACEAQGKSGPLAALWDVTLRLESLLSFDEAGARRIQEIERKRRQAVMGPEEDVATGGLLRTSDVALIGAQKATISEQLVRTEGYDISSNIVSGMRRSVNLLEVMGLWSSDGPENPMTQRKMKDQGDDDVSGGKSDISYYRRLRFEELAASGLAAEAAAGDAMGVAGAKMLSARERLQQGTPGGAATAGQQTPMMLAIQQSPEWLRSLLILLPASRLRLPIVAKPPPHLTELALSSLRQGQLPSERPSNATNRSNKRKADGGDSSDEENGTQSGMGYGNYFRNRQRQRIGSELIGDAE